MVIREGLLERVFIRQRGGGGGLLEMKFVIVFIREGILESGGGVL